MSKYKNYQPLIFDIKFYLIDEDGNALLNKDGSDKQFRLKEGIRFKPLEYLTDDMETDILEEIKMEKMDR
jgi:hypothetical protein